MKCYVIKNKEGKYCQISFNGWMGFVNELCNAYICHSRQGAEKLFIKCHELEDCEVVEVTIAKGDLEKENAMLRKALELACEDLSLYEDITTAKYKAKCYIQQAKEELKDE